MSINNFKIIKFVFQQCCFLNPLDQRIKQSYIPKKFRCLFRA